MKTPSAFTFNGWQYALPVAGVVFLLTLAIFYETAWSAVAIWNRSDTYTHGFLILPIVLWLIWNRRDFLSVIQPTPEFWACIPLALAGFIWFVGRLGDALVVQQFGLVAMLISGVWMVVGNAVMKQLSFPLAFLFFAVPVGEDLVPPMMVFTADFTVGLIRLTGIPVFREGLHFSLPSGNWSVVQGCSGIRYLIASITLGCLYAYLTYRSLWRRILFIIASAIVPIVANGLRAFIIVMLGHLSDMKLAVGVDHLLYGWVFFGLVMLLLFAVGSIWREPPETTATQRTILDNKKPEIRPVVLAKAAISVLALVIIWPLAAYSMQQRVSVPLADLEAPVAKLGWEDQGRPKSGWRPLLTGFSDELNRAYTNGDNQIELYVRQFLTQQQGNELIGKRNVIDDEQDHDWKLIARSKQNFVMGDREVPMIKVHLRGAEGDILIWYWYRLGSRVTTSAYIGKLLGVLSHLTFDRTDAVFLAVATPLDISEVAAQRTLERFVTDMLVPIEEVLDRSVGEK